MTKRIIQDVVFPSKRTKEEVKRSSPEAVSATPHEPLVSGNNTQPSQEPSDFLPRLVKKQESGEATSSAWVRNTNNTSSKSPRVILWVVAMVVFVGMLGAILSTFFSGATVKIVPLNNTVSLAIDFTARENAADLPA